MTKIVLLRPHRHVVAVLQRLGGPDPESKRHVSSTLIAVGALLVPVAFVLSGFATPVLAVSGAILTVVGLMVGGHASALQRIEARASDLAEWKREEQRFRRAMGLLWGRLRRGYGNYAGMRGWGNRSLDNVVEEAEWPAAGTADEQLETFARVCMTNRIEGAPNGWAIEGVRHSLSRDGTSVADDFVAAKDIVELWATALDAGGSSASALREILRGLRAHHEVSLKLLSYLSLAHSRAHEWPHEPNHDYLGQVHSAMHGRV